MKTLLIQRVPGLFGQPRDTRILSDESLVGEIKADEKEKKLEISKGEHSIQAEISDDGGRKYRSNVYFTQYGNKDVTLYLKIQGSKLTLLDRPADAEK